MGALATQIDSYAAVPFAAVGILFWAVAVIRDESMSPEARKAWIREFNRFGAYYVPACWLTAFSSRKGAAAREQQGLLVAVTVSPYRRALFRTDGGS